MPALHRQPSSTILHLALLVIINRPRCLALVQPRSTVTHLYSICDPKDAEPWNLLQCHPGTFPPHTNMFPIEHRAASACESVGILKDREDHMIRRFV